MTRLNTRYNWGQTLSVENPDLYRQLNDVYSIIASNTNGKCNKASMLTAPQADNDVNKNYDIGDIWVNTQTNSAWIMTSRTTPTAVTWKQFTLI